MMKRLKFLGPIFCVGILLGACEAPIIEKVEAKHPNNEPKKISYYKNDNGNEVLVEEKFFHDNGQFEMGGQYVNGMRSGTWKAYFKNGKLQSEGAFEQGKRTGKALVYYPNGQLRYEGEYAHDIKVGVWKFYNEQGKLVKEEDYK